MSKFTLSNLEANLFTNFREIYTELRTEAHTPKINDLVIFAGYLTHLDDIEIALKNKQQPPSCSIEFADIMRIINAYPDVFSQYQLAALSERYDEFMGQWMMSATEEQIQQILFYNKQIRAKLAANLKLALNTPMSSIDPLPLCVWMAFEHGTVTSHVMKYYRELGIDSKDLVTAIEQAHADPNNHQKLGQAVAGYREWVESHRWYHLHSIVWAYLKWLINIGENYDTTLSQTFTDDHLRLVCLETRPAGPVTTLGEIDVEQLEFMQQEIKELQLSINGLKESIEKIDPEFVASSLVKLLEAEKHIAKLFTNAPPSKDSTTKMLEAITKEANRVTGELNQRVGELEARADKFDRTIQVVRGRVPAAQAQSFTEQAQRDPSLLERLGKFATGKVMREQSERPKQNTDFGVNSTGPQEQAKPSMFSVWR